MIGGRMGRVNMAGAENLFLGVGQPMSMVPWQDGRMLKLEEHRTTNIERPTSNGYQWRMFPATACRTIAVQLAAALSQSGERGVKLAKSVRNGAGGCPLARFNSLALGSARLRSLGGGGGQGEDGALRTTPESVLKMAKTVRLFRLIPLNSAWYAYFRLAVAGRVFGILRAPQRIQKWQIRGSEWVRWLAFARLSSARLAFARLFAASPGFWRGMRKQPIRGSA